MHGLTPLPNKQAARLLATNRARDSTTNRRKLAQKFNQNSVKSTALELKICTEQIQQATNLIPKNHRLRFTQTPGKIDCSQARKWGKNEEHIERKSQLHLMNPGGHREDSGLISHSKS
jgi:hypothetical protein